MRRLVPFALAALGALAIALALDPSPVDAQVNLSPRGDITSVSATAGGGLTGGAASGSASLGLITTCVADQFLSWNGTDWTCSAYTAGDGLTLTAFDFDITYTSDFAITADQLDLSTAVTAPGTLGVAGLLTASGGLTSTAGTTTVGALLGTVETVATAGTIDDLPLGASTTVLRLTGAAQLNGVTGGAGGRVLTIFNDTAGTVAIATEAAGSVAANRFGLAGGVALRIATRGTVSCVYEAVGARWRCEDDYVFTAITTSLSLVVGTTATVTTDLTVNGNTTLGNAATDTVSIPGDLTVTDSAVFNGPISLGDAAADVISANGLLVFNDDDGGPSMKDGGLTLSTCGTGPTSLGNRFGGTVTTGTSATACTITFTTAFGATPTCVVTPQGSARPTYTVSTTAITLSGAAASAKYDFLCVDHS